MNPNEFNTALAKRLQNLKKEGIAENVNQNYKGTGSQAHRRQIFVRFSAFNSIDVWLNGSHIKIGGVIDSPRHIANLFKTETHDDATLSAAYAWIVKTLAEIKAYRAACNA